MKHLAEQICKFLSKDIYGETNPDMLDLQIESLAAFLETIKPDKYGSCDLCGWAYESWLEDW